VKKFTVMLSNWETQTVDANYWDMDDGYLGFYNEESNEESIEGYDVLYAPGVWFAVREVK
jgi:hypothetical protein